MTSLALTPTFAQRRPETPVQNKSMRQIVGGILEESCLVLLEEKKHELESYREVYVSLVN